MENKFNKEYFETLNYADYKSRKNRYSNMSRELIDFFRKIDIINKNTKILDYGCAFGFLVNGFYEMDYNNVFGYDISEWAIKIAEQTIKIKKDIKNEKFDIGIFLDVLEHMTDKDIIDLLEMTHFKYIIVRIPCSNEINPDEFFLEISKLDKTHINCKSPDNWKKFFKGFGFDFYFNLNLYTIYNSDGCFCAIFCKNEE